MKVRSRTEYTALNILSGLGGYVLNTILGFICRMVFVRYLSADYLGVNGLFTNILSMLSLAELGVGSAIVFALYKPLAEKDEQKIASLVAFYGKAYRIIGLVVALVGLALMPFLNVIIQEQPAITESLYLLYLLNLFNSASTYFFSYRSSLIIAAQQNYVVSAVSYIISIVQSVVQMVLLAYTRNYIAYLLVQTAGTLIYNVAISQIAVKRFPCIRSKNIQPLPQEDKKGLFRNIRDLMVYKVSGLLVNSTDNIMITFFDGLATTGVASNYSLLVNTLNSLLSQVFNGLTASVGNHNAIEDNEHKYSLFKFLNMMNFWIFGWGALGIFYCSSDLVQLCFGSDFVMDTSIPFVMALNFFSVGMMNAVWTYKHTMGLFHYGRFTQIFTGILNIAFSVLLGTYYGLFGVLIATFIARIMTNLWYDPYVVFTHGFGKSPWLYVQRLTKYLLLLLITAALCQVSFALVGGSQLTRTLLKIILCSIITNGVFFLAFFRTPEFAMLKGYASRMWRKITKRNLRHDRNTCQNTENNT